MEAITVSIKVDAPIEQIWKLWNTPEDIKMWNNVSEQWHTPFAENNLQLGGKLLLTMGLKNGSFSFDFEAIYQEIDPYKRIRYTLTDGRSSTIVFAGIGPVTITETFEPNQNDSIEMQRDFCQSVLMSFKKYAEETDF